MSPTNVQRALFLFPLGLVALGAASFVFYFLSKNAALPEDENKLLRSTGEITEMELRGFVETLAVKIGPRHVGDYDKLRSAGVWLQSMLGEGNFGYKVEKQNYDVDGKACFNVVAEIPGGSRADEIVVVGAHYDSIPGCPGANDNGSGVAALLALARTFFGSENQRTLRFVAFVNEEPPHFHTDAMGSLVYARRCAEREEKIAGMLALETMGCFTDAPDTQKVPPGVRRVDYPTTGNFIAFITRTGDEELVREAESAFARTSGFPVVAAALPEQVPGVTFSDHWSFWQAGFPAIMVTDTAMLRYEHYHQPTDTPDKLNYPALTEVVRGLQGVVYALANPDV